MSRPAPITAPFGAWRSPLSADALAGGTLRLGACSLAPDGTLLWTEGRPAEGGRTVLVRRRPDGTSEDLTPAPFNVRSRVHEYGGVAFAAGPDGIHFVNFADQRIYTVRPGGAPPEPLVADGSGWRFAELAPDSARRRLVAVGEWHDPGRPEPENAIVAVGLGDGAVQRLASGHDFYAAPALSPDGRWLAYLAWDHPHLPWDAAALYLRPLDADGRPGPERLIAGDARASVFQPGWSAAGELHFVWEPSGFWNLYRLRDGRVQAVAPIAAEAGTPLWGLGTKTWGFVDARTVLAAFVEEGRTFLGRIDLESGAVSRLPTPVASVGHLSVAGGKAALLAGWSDRPGILSLVDAVTGAEETVRSSATVDLPAPFVSGAEPIAFPTSEGDTAHGFFYPPRNPGFRGPEGERPPLLVLVHGGPTGATAPTLSLAVQYFTTRGIAVLDVNYRGSSGYGRAYRDRLQGQWGGFDVDDCVAGARFLAAAGKVDGRRLAIRGGSAGGYTVLAALAFRDAFAAGASHYGVSDLEALARDTHKFEARYLDGLIGPYPAARATYQARSPINFVDRLSCPVIFFQGLEDKVVPPNQAEAMVEALRRKGLDTEYHAFAGEQHGFRRADTIRRVYEAELAFYGRRFGFTPAP